MFCDYCDRGELTILYDEKNLMIFSSQGGTHTAWTLQLTRSWRVHGIAYVPACATGDHARG